MLAYKQLLISILFIVIFTGCNGPFIPVKVYQYNANVKIDGQDYNLSKTITGWYKDSEWYPFSAKGPDWTSDAYSGFNGVIGENDKYHIEPAVQNLNMTLFQLYSFIEIQRYSNGIYDTRIFVKSNRDSKKKYFEEFNTFAKNSTEHKIVVTNSKIVFLKEYTTSYYELDKNNSLPFLVKNSYATVWKREFNREYINRHLALKVMIRDKDIPWIGDQKIYYLDQYKYKNHPVEWPGRQNENRMDNLYYGHSYQYDYQQLFFDGENWKDSDDKNQTIFWVKDEENDKNKEIAYEGKVFILKKYSPSYIYDPKKDILIEYSIEPIFDKFSNEQT